jgi:hypothetical protein
MRVPLPKLLFLAAGLLLVLLTAPALHAVEVTDLYTAAVPIDSRDQNATARAARDALREVLVKVAGTESVLEAQALQPALRNAPDYAQQYRFSTGEDGEQLLSVDFDADVVTRLLADAGAPIWTANRPPALVWLVLATESGRDFADPAAAPEAVAALREAFSRRGVPLQLPLYDLADAASMSPGAAWRQDTGLVAAASGRYRAEDILIGRAAQTSSGAWLGNWAYVHAGIRRDRAVTAASLDEFAAEGAALVANLMSARYAVRSSTVADGSSALVEVAGISSFADYRAVIAWLESLELVDHANPETVIGDRMTIRISSRAPLEELVPVIELNEHFVVQAPTDLSAARGYRWTP